VWKFLELCVGGGEGEGCVCGCGWMRVCVGRGGVCGGVCVKPDLAILLWDWNPLKPKPQFKITQGGTIPQQNLDGVSTPL